MLFWILFFHSDLCLSVFPKGDLVARGAVSAELMDCLLGSHCESCIEWCSAVVVGLPRDVDFSSSYWGMRTLIADVAVFVFVSLARWDGGHMCAFAVHFRCRLDG